MTSTGEKARQLASSSMPRSGVNPGRPLRIAVVNWQCRENPMAGGAEIHLHEIFGRLAAMGHEVVLHCGGWPGCAPRAVLDGIEVHRVGTRQTWPFLAKRYWDAHLAQRNFDVLVEDINKTPLFTSRWNVAQVVGLVPHLFGGTAFRELPIPLAAAVWLSERPLPYMYRGLPFEAISESTADDLVSRGIARENIRVIFPGIDTVHYTPGPMERSATPLFAYLGRLKKYKGVDLVIRAFAKLQVPEARLEIAGAGEYRQHLEQLTASLGLTDRVTFLGRIDERAKVSLLRRSWATLFASPKEGWGITNLEAAACGTPVVASNSPGIRESVVHGETGFLVPHGDTEAMAIAMRRICTNRDLVESLGIAARQFAARFTWENAAIQTGEHLQEVVTMRSTRGSKGNR